MLNEIFVGDNGAQGIPDHVVGHVGIPSLGELREATGSYAGWAESMLGGRAGAHY